MHGMHRLKVITRTTALAGAVIAVAAPVAGASDRRPTDTGGGVSPVCLEIALEGPWSVLGQYGVLGDYGPAGSKAGQANPAAQCFTKNSLGMTMFTLTGS
jgi:hypothetical protein